MSNATTRPVDQSLGLPTIIRQEFTNAMSAMGLANIEKFGQYGDNVDTGPAIMSALAKSAIVIPPQLYGIGTQIEVPSDATIKGFKGRDYYSFSVGAQRGKSRLKVIPSGYSGTKLLNLGGRPRITLDHIGLDGSGGNSQNSVIDGIAGGSTGLTVRGLDVIGCRYAFGDPTFAPTRIAKIIHSTFGNNVYGPSVFIDSDFVECEFSANKQHNLLLQSSASVVLNNCRYEWSPKTNIALFDATDIQIVGGISDASGSQSMKFDGKISHVDITGVHFRRSSRLDQAETFGGQPLNAHINIGGDATTKARDISFELCRFSHGVNDDGTGVDTPIGRIFFIRNNVDRLRLFGNKMVDGVVSPGKFITIADQSPTNSEARGNFGLADIAYGATWTTV